MSKILAVARAEVGMIIRTKAFLVTMLLMPVFLVGSVVIPQLLAKHGDTEPKRFAVIDRSGQIGPALAADAETRNAPIRAGGLPAAPFIPELRPPAADVDAQRLSLSQQVREDALWAFVEIPADVLDPAAQAKVLYYSSHPTYDDLPKWIDATVEKIVREKRLVGDNLDPQRIEKLIAPIGTQSLGLFARGPNGEIKPAVETDWKRDYIVPFGLMYILFLTIFISAPQLMNVVIQEKMTKISEVLLGSVTPFELMMGKLLGGAGASGVMGLVYVAGATFAAAKFGIGDAITPPIIAMFLVFMVLAILVYGSIFVAVGAAVSDLKDAQSLITPVMLIAVLPMFAVTTVIKSPASPLSVGLSLIPPATPFVMLLRAALQPPPPLWQVLLGIVLTAGFALACVGAAAKIFRVGILSTGKSASFGELLRWIRAK